jgi:hypothetical protein
MMRAGDEPVAIPAAAPVVKMESIAPKESAQDSMLDLGPEQTAPIVHTAPAASLVAHSKQAVQTSAPVAATSSEPTGSLSEIWAKVINLMTGRSQKILLSKLTLESIDSSSAVIAAPHESFEMAQAAEPEIEASLISVLGRRIKIEFRDAGKSPESAPVQQQGGGSSISQIESNPLIKRATELFGARIVSVQPRRPSGAAPPPAQPAPKPSEDTAQSGDE